MELYRFGEFLPDVLEMLMWSGYGWKKYWRGVNLHDDCVGFLFEVEVLVCGRGSWAGMSDLCRSVMDLGLGYFSIEGHI